MTDTPKTELLIPLEDEETDPLFEKADALMQRHATFAIEPELDDLPVLTEVVEALAPTPDTPAEPPMVVVREGWWSRKVAERPREVLRREDEGKKR